MMQQNITLSDQKDSPEVYAKACEVTLEIISVELDLDQISAVLGFEGDPSSHDKGSPCGKNDSWNYTVWKTPPLEVEEANINTCISQLLHKPAVISLQKRRSELHNVETCIDVAIFHQSLNCSLSISSVNLKEIGNMHLDLVVTTYPCD